MASCTGCLRDGRLPLLLQARSGSPRIITQRGNTTMCFGRTVQRERATPPSPRTSTFYGPYSGGDVVWCYETVITRPARAGEMGFVRACVWVSRAPNSRCGGNFAAAVASCTGCLRDGRLPLLLQARSGSPRIITQRGNTTMCFGRTVQRERATPPSPQTSTSRA